MGSGYFIAYRLWQRNRSGCFPVPSESLLIHGIPWVPILFKHFNVSEARKQLRESDPFRKTNFPKPEHLDCRFLTKKRRKTKEIRDSSLRLVAGPVVPLSEASGMLSLPLL